MARIIVSILLTALLVFGGIMLSKRFSQNPAEDQKVRKVAPKGVFVESVVNQSIPVEITSNGQLVAYRRVALTAEVTGVLKSSTFKEGSTFRKGQTICAIDDSEYHARVTSERSNFHARLLTIMPDLKLDYNDSWAIWDNYLRSIDISKNLPPLPDMSDERTKNFITANGIITTYQNIKNLEIRSGKYFIIAPFNGVITQANVQEGSLITMSQPIGEISSLGDYELELPVNVQLLDFLEIGRSIALTTIDGKDDYTGKIERINPTVDVNSQSIKAYIRVTDNSLREGLFLQAKMDAGTIDNAVEMDRKLLDSENKIFIVLADSILGTAKVNPVHFKTETVVVTGLEEGMVFVQKSLPGAYVGMKVQVLENATKAPAL